MSERTASWEIGHDALGPPLAAEIERINREGPYHADDPVVEQAPRWAYLVDGAFQPVNPPTEWHDWVAMEVGILLRQLLGARGFSLAPSAVRTRGGATVRGADVVAHVGIGPRDLRVESTYSHHVPALVVEVLSPTTAAEDRGAKKVEYEEIGVREYYLLDPDSGAVEAFALRDRAFVTLARTAPGFASGVLQTTWDPASVLEP